jgi:hypothetical protein
VCHSQQENWQRENGGNPETQGHIFGLGISLLRFSRGDNGLESHSADWAVAGLIPADLRMHRTGVDGLCVFLKREILLKTRLNTGKPSTRDAKTRMIPVLVTDKTDFHRSLLGGSATDSVW